MIIGNINKKSGWVEVIFGCMFAGKSSELLRRIEILKIAKQKFLVFSPKIDDRYGKGKIASHSGRSHPSTNVAHSDEILKALKDDINFIIIDEIQFFDKGIIKVVEDLANKGKKIIVAGLSADFRGIPFDITTNLIVRAEFITKLNSICNVCYDSAHKIQRLTNGKPSSANEKTITVGDWDNIHYESRCRNCYIIPDFDWQKNCKKENE